MNQISENIINFIKSIYCLVSRDLRLQFRNLSDIISVITFYMIGVLVFIFAIGPDEEQLRIIGVAILWVILILSSSISINKSLKEDYEDGNIALYQFTGISFELISLIKIFVFWILYQLPLIIIIPLISIILNIPLDKIYLLIITMVIGSPTITVLVLISSAMLLTNTRNLTLGSIIVLPMSIPVIIFAMGAIDSDIKLFYPQIYILSSMLLASLALGPWVISACIKIALKN